MHHLIFLAALLPSPASPTVLAPELRGDTAAVRTATAEVRSGLSHASGGNPAGAAAAYARAAERVPAFGPWAHALSAAAAARAGDTATVRRHLAATDAEIARDWGWRARVDAAAAAGDTVGAAAVAAAAAAAMPDTARRVQAWVRAGSLHAAAGRRADALALLRRAIDESVAPAAAVEAARLLGTLPQLTADDRRRIGRVYLRHRNLPRAAEAYDAYIATAQPPAALRATINLELGRGLFDTRDYPAAERRLRQAAATAGANRETVAEASFLLGRALYRQGRNQDARATFMRVTREHAGTRVAAQAHFLVADIDHDAGNLETARTHYRAVVQANGPDAALSATRLGVMALVERRPRDAAAVFRDAWVRLAGPGRQQAGYWLAHSLEQAGARDSARTVMVEARALDPFSYYGLRAGERLEAGLWDFAASEPAAAAAGARAEIAARLDALDILRAVELSEAGDLEAGRIAARFAGTGGGMYALGEAYHARGQTFNGIRLGRELLRREGGTWNRQLLQLVYPFPYREDVVRYARANGLDPYLVAGLIRQESMFNPRARSAAGAIGLMQVMPQTGTAVARGLGISGFQTSRLTDPETNLRIGTRYLADQIRRHNGRMVDAIAAYNAGPQRVTRWQALPEYRDPELFTERIPFQETRDYVKIVQQNARIYRELYGGS